MRLVRLRLAGLAVLPAAALLLTTPPATAADASRGLRASIAPVSVLAGTSAAETFVADDSVAAPAARRATFNVTYIGFTAPAKAAFQRAVDYWAGQVTSSVPITVRAEFKPLGTNVLGQAGPSSVWRDFTGAPAKATWYVDAIANKRFGRQLDPSPDIQASFSSNFSNWHYGTGAAPNGKYDFQSVVLHELGHGLGFLGAGRVSGSQGTVRLSGYPISYDRYTENGAGKQLLTYADPSAALKQQLTSGKVFFDSALVRNANGGKPAKLYAPGSFSAGSTYSHFDEATYRAGNKNSLMTPQIGDGETIRSAGPLMLAVYKTIGW